MNLKMWVNKREIQVHCPACGWMKFYQPKSFLPTWDMWYRCKKCNLDIRIDERECMINMVMEEVFDE